jgi:DmsE family decaheme c-type cytochrome
MGDSQWQKTEHAKIGVSCLSCHQIHSGTEAGSRRQVVTSPAYVAVKPGHCLLRGSETETCARCHKQQVNEFKQNYHHPIQEGRMVCSDCHSPHPTKSDAKKADIHKQMRVTCHADVVGPFVYEHDPVTGWSGDGCVECHKPHGSHNPGLLKSFSHGLCSQCHTDKAAAHYAGQTCFTSGCHSLPHGSNSSPYFFLGH